MDFDITRTEIPVKIDGVAYVLREASAKDAKQWRGLMAASQYVTDGQMGIKASFAESEPLLVSLCLTQEGKRVPQETVEAWPSKIVRALFQKAKDISDLNEKPPTVEAMIKQRDMLTKEIEKVQSKEAEDKETKN